MVPKLYAKSPQKTVMNSHSVTGYFKLLKEIAISNLSEVLSVTSSR